MQSVFLYVDNALMSDNEYRKFSLNIMVSKETVLTRNNRFIYCKREVDYAFYGTYACDTRIVRYVGILRRLVVLAYNPRDYAKLSSLKVFCGYLKKYDFLLA